MPHRFAGIVAVLLLSGSPLAGQAVMAGIVRDDSTNRPMAGVEVLLERSKRLAVTDNSGRYLLMGLPTGTKVALFRFVGYRPVRLRVELSKTDTAYADARMVREGVQRLETVEVTGRPAGARGIGVEAFEERRRMGFGKFIDSAELRRSEVVRLPDVFRRHGIWVFRTQDPFSLRIISVAASKRRIGPTGELCYMQVILDGASIYSPSTARKPPIDLDMFSVASLQAVEVYASTADTPMEFGGEGGDCGTVVLWSRKR